MARKFYIIGHNPNSIDEAIQCLEQGANAIEPDVCYDAENRRFMVHEQIPFLPPAISRWIFKGPTLEEYLTALAGYLAEHPSANLSLIAFDLKGPYTYDINLLYRLVRDTFSRDYPKVAILTTAGNRDGMEFLSRTESQRLNEAVGIDERTAPDDVDNFFRPGGLHFTYANGISLWLIPTTWYRGDIARALQLRDQGNGNRFKLVYAWTVNCESSMKTYLDMGVDGLVTNNVNRLLGVLRRKEYTDAFRLATVEDTPFA